MCFLENRIEKNTTLFRSLVVVRDLLHKGHRDALIAVNIKVEGVNGITAAGDGSRGGASGSGDGRRDAAGLVTRALHRCITGYQ